MCLSVCCLVSEGAGWFMVMSRFLDRYPPYPIRLRYNDAEWAVRFSSARSPTFLVGGMGVINRVWTLIQIPSGTVALQKHLVNSPALPRLTPLGTHCVPMLHCPLLDRVLGRLKVRVFPFRGRRQPNHRLGVQAQLDPFQPPPIIFAGVDVNIYMVGI